VNAGAVPSPAPNAPVEAPNAVAVLEAFPLIAPLLLENPDMPVEVLAEKTLVGGGMFALKTLVPPNPPGALLAAVDGALPNVGVRKADDD